MKPSSDGGKTNEYIKALANVVFFRRTLFQKLVSDVSPEKTCLI
jgi:hypothetical protein